MSLSSYVDFTDSRQPVIRGTAVIRLQEKVRQPPHLPLGLVRIPLAQRGGVPHSLEHLTAGEKIGGPPGPRAESAV